MHEHHRLRRRTCGVEDFLLIGERVIQNHRRGGEIAEHKLVALLGDRRGRGDVDDVRDALLFGDLRDGTALARVEGTDQKLRAVCDQFLGARARNVDIGLCVGVHDLQFGQPNVLKDRTGQLDAAEAILPDAGLIARARQQHADFERSALRAQDRGGAEQPDRGRAGKQTAAGKRVR